MTSQNAKDLTRQRFGKFAQGYVNSHTFANAPELGRLVILADPQPHWRLLDIATGGGHTALAFLPHVHLAVASDLTEAMLVSAREHARQVSVEFYPRMAYHVADAEDLPYQAKSFHLVTCRIAPHHFPDPGQFVQEASRVLQQGGVLAMQDILMPPDSPAADYLNSIELLRDPSHQRALPQLEWEALFSAARLQVSHVEKAVLKHAFLPWVNRQGCTPQVIAQLAEIFRQAPPAAQAWCQPAGFDGDLSQAVFFAPHILITGRKF